MLTTDRRVRLTFSDLQMKHFLHECEVIPRSKSQLPRLNERIIIGGTHTTLKSAACTRRTAL